MPGNTFDGQTLLLTGATGNIGTATAKLYAERGANIFAVDIPGTDWSVFEAEVGHGDRVAHFDADVSQEEQVEAYVAAAKERFGRIDIFFNNAGIEGENARLEDLTVDGLMKVLKVNVVGVMLGLKHVLRVMYAQGSGAIVNAASSAALGGSPGLAPYITSKHAVLGLTRTAALEAGSTGIRVNCVAPGPIEGRMMSSINEGQGGADKMKEATEASIPAGRYGYPEEVAGLVAFLGSQDASYCNGTYYSVDGGLQAA
ncbi:SDR family oxidoreductase [Mesobaculum littorinae]|uniref:SDR family oxidoreductase n=1 Tax=Mesobaculum littorinae TaxID=2486419 RepID=A0A438AES4_9RHOB|nr:SDR family oxidoreductase [Mesobaculum littorinae]RVV97194.1 SDR family oxidoreductase [Mesobaculum littorinae]